MTDRDAVSARHDEFVASFATEDVEAMSEFLSDDHVGMPPNQPQLVGKDAAKEYWRNGFSMASSEFSTRSRSVTVAGDVAVDRFQWEMAVSPRDGSPAMRDTGKCVWIWRRGADGTWRLATAIWNSDLDKPALWGGG